MEHPDCPILYDARKQIESCGVGLEVLPAVTPSKGTTLRRCIRDGAVGHQWLPDGVWNVIKSHVGVFADQP